MPNKKKFAVGFYTGTLGKNGTYESIHETLNALLRLPEPFAHKEGDNAYIVKGLSAWNSGRNLSGILCKVRMSDVPHIGDAAGHEEEIDLADDEGLLEKNHFIYTARRKLLIFQENFYGSRTSLLEDYLTEFSGTAVSFGPIIRPDVMKRLMKGDVMIRSMDIGIARPTNPKMFPSDDFSNAMMQLLHAGGAATLKVHINANLPGTRGGSLSKNLKSALSELLKIGKVRSAKVEIDVKGKARAINLIEDRIAAKCEVPMDGRYPQTKQMFEAMEAARREVSGDLDAFFGSNEEALD